MAADFRANANVVPLNSDVEAMREESHRYTEHLCKDDQERLPPLRVISHSIPLIDEKKIYPWHPSRCPEVFRAP
jgi:hypothetical protein